MPTGHAMRRLRLFGQFPRHIIRPFAAGADQTVIPDVIDQIGGVAFGTVFGVEDYH